MHHQIHRIQRFITVSRDSSVCTEDSSQGESWLAQLIVLEIDNFVREEPVLLAEIKAIDRFKVKQPGHDGLMCEMLWTDPQDALGRGPSKRGVGIGFGPDITKAWTEANSVTAVIRSHEVRQGGYSVEHNGLCITVFSAPNYVDAVGKSRFLYSSEATLMRGKS